MGVGRPTPLKILPPFSTPSLNKFSGAGIRNLGVETGERFPHAQPIIGINK